MSCGRYILTLILCLTVRRHVDALSISDDRVTSVQPMGLHAGGQNATTVSNNETAGHLDSDDNNNNTNNNNDDDDDESRYENIGCVSGSCDSISSENVLHSSKNEEPGAVDIVEDGEEHVLGRPDVESQSLCGQGGVGEYDYYGTGSDYGGMSNCGDEFGDVRKENSVTFSTVSMAISIFGAIANGLVVLTWSKMQNNSTTFLLTFLGVADFAFVSTMFVVNVFFIAREMYSYTINWLFFFSVYLSYGAQFTSILTTLLVSFTRYASIRFPFKVQLWLKRSVIQLFIIIILFVSFLAAFPASSNLCLFLYMFTSGEAGLEPSGVNVTNGNNNCLISGNDEMMNLLSNVTLPPCVNGSEGVIDDSLIEKKIEVCTFMETYQYSFPLLTAVLMNILPWIVVIPLNILLINEVRKSYALRKKKLSKDEQNSQTMDIVVVIMTLQSIIAYPIFFIAELLTNKIDWNFYFGGEPPLPIDHEDTAHLTTCRDWLQLLNSSANIVAYCACGKKFRKHLLQDVLKCFKDDTGQPFSRQKTKMSVENSSNSRLKN